MEADQVRSRQKRVQGSEGHPASGLQHIAQEWDSSPHTIYTDSPGSAS